METIKNVLTGGNNDSNLTGESSHLAGSSERSTGDGLYSSQTGHDSLGGGRTTEGVASNVPGAFPDVSGGGGGGQPTSYNEPSSSSYGNTSSRSGVEDNSSTSYDKTTSSSGYGNTSSRNERDVDSRKPTGEAVTGSFETNEPAMAPSTIRDESNPAVGTTYTARKFPLASGSDSYGSNAPTGEAYATEVTSRLDDTMRRDPGNEGPSGSTTATGAGVVGATGAGAYGSQRDDNQRGEGTRDEGSRYGTSAAVGTAAATGAGGAYASHQLTSKNDDLGPAKNTAGPHKSDTLNKADPRVEDNPEKARDMVMDLRTNPKTGEEKVVLMDSDMDKHQTVVDPDEQRQDDDDDEGNDEEGKKKSKGSKILGVFGIGKDKDKKSEDSGTRDTRESSDTRDVGSSDYNKSSRDNERSDYTSTAATSQSAYDQRPSERSYDRSNRQDDNTTEGRDSQDGSNNNDGNGNGEKKKKRGSLSGIFHRDNPNRLHKEPPPDHPLRRSVDNNDRSGDNSRGDNDTSRGGGDASGPHYGIDGEIGRDREASGYGGGDARQTTTVEDIQQREQSDERQY